MKEIKLEKTTYGLKLTDGEYDEPVSVGKDEDGKLVLSNCDHYTRGLFTTAKWRKHHSGTLKLEDIEPKLLVHGETSKVFELVPDKCTFGYRSGILHYESLVTKEKIIVEEIHEWDE